jgi:hypothetical protein
MLGPPCKPGNFGLQARRKRPIPARASNFCNFRDMIRVKSAEQLIRYPCYLGALIVVGLLHAGAVGADAPALANQAHDAAAAISVMVVGVAHFSNPGHDLHDPSVDDVFSARRQAEIQKVVDALAEFRPTKILVEWPASKATTAYAAFCAGKLPPSRNEGVQLGFRLARQMGLPAVDGVDVMGDFPYEAVQHFAEAGGQTALLAEVNSDWATQAREMGDLLHAGSIRDLLHFINSPGWIEKSQHPYRLLLAIGRGPTQPGADLLAAWYRRNFYISANVVQAVHRGDRVVIFYGAGHTFLLRQLVAEMPGWVLVEPNSYL